jgi:hypothetical protein
MRIGDPSPQWAQDLVGHWINFYDRFFDKKDLKVFVWHTDFFGHSAPERQVRIFGDLQSQVLEQLQTGELPFGLYASYIMEGDYQIIDPPEGMAEWTVNRRSGMNQ